MKNIRLTQTKIAVVSDRDYSRLNRFNWFYHRNPKDRTGYAVRWLAGTTPRKIIRMHWEIKGKNCDHKNGDGIDNRRSNLRKADLFQQAWNKFTRSRFKGVSFVRDKKGVKAYCIARISVKGKRLYLGVFESEQLAFKAYKHAAKKYHGKFARF